MKYDLTFPIHDADGKQSVDPDDKTKKITVREAFERCLLSEFYEAPGCPMPAGVKLARYRLFQRVCGKAKTLEATVEEAAVLKKAAEAFPTLIYGQMVDFIDRGGEDQSDREAA